uniref:Uncharacterized protein n=1 Tax=Cacopsylla melanoneura TaxID=428564 RepID=A0A8D8LBD8_9HEMI
MMGFLIILFHLKSPKPYSHHHYHHEIKSARFLYICTRRVPAEKKISGESIVVIAKVQIVSDDLSWVIGEILMVGCEGGLFSLNSACDVIVISGGVQGQV